jgi:hypothetical protein
VQDNFETERTILKDRRKILEDMNELLESLRGKDGSLDMTPIFKAFMQMRNNYMRRICASIMMAEAFEWNKYMRLIPPISFPPTWKVQMIPPYANAMLRFIAHDGDEQISVYLDCFEMIGCYGGPYWEAYVIDGDTYRCDMNDVDELISVLKNEFKRRRKLNNMDIK